MCDFSNITRLYPTASSKKCWKIKIKIHETCTHWLQFYMVDQYRLTLLILFLFLFVLVEHGIMVKSYVTLIVYLHCFMEGNQSG